MRVVVQRVKSASVSIGGNVKSSIRQGLLLLVGIEAADGDDDIAYITKKVVALRIFDDDSGVMNRSVVDVGGEMMVVSQFTLMASTKKGNRPSYIRAAAHDISIPRYNQLVEALSEALGRPVATGTFGADMQVTLINDGPVTIIIDSKQRDY